MVNTFGCILSKFYIKPQHVRADVVILADQLYLIEILHQTTTWYDPSDSVEDVVSYRNSTSNHNFVDASILTLIERCILSKFYIKPQLSDVHTFS